MNGIIKSIESSNLMVIGKIYEYHHVLSRIPSSSSYIQDVTLGVLFVLVLQDELFENWD